MPTVLLIRHAQASYGTSDYDVLSPRGEEQVEVLWQSLARRGVTPDLIVTGTLKRQRDTAPDRPQIRHVARQVDQRWNEYDDHDVLSQYSDSAARVQRHDGAPAISSRDFQVVADRALRDWVHAGAASRCRQSWSQFTHQTDQALAEVIGELARGQTALVFSSSGVIAALAASLIGVAGEGFIALNRVSVNTGITKIISGSRGRTLVTYNDHSHLEEAGNSLLTYR